MACLLVIQIEIKAVSQGIASDFTYGDHLWWKGSKLAKGMLRSNEEKKGNLNCSKHPCKWILQGVCTQNLMFWTLNQKCTFMSEKQDLYSMFPIKRTVYLCTVTLVKNTVRLIGNIEYIHEMRKFDLCPLDLVENNIPVLHSLSPEWYHSIHKYIFLKTSK